MKHSLIFAVAISLAAACGKSSTEPSSGSSSGGPSGQGNCAVIEGNKGTIQASINGASYSGTVPIGRSNYAPNISMIVSAISNDNVTMVFTILLPKIGSNGIGSTPSDPFNGSTISLAMNNCSGLIGTWSTSNGGSGTVNISSLSAVGAIGTFTATLVPLSGGATGTKAITNGQFNVTF